MSDIRRRTIVEKRIVIGADGAWVSREGGSITISYDYAGRVTKDEQRFYVEDIKALYAFVRETDAEAA